MIDAKLVSARRDRVDVLSTTLALAAGRHALLGRKEDGVALLLACFAGDVRHRGTLRVLDARPTDARARARVAYIPLATRLPDVLRVDETLALARRIRKNAPIDALAVLEPLGIAALARRRIESLDASEVRAVALAEALASPSVSVILIEEPFVMMTASAVAALPSALATKKNTCIVSSTASVADASRVAADYAIFDRGRLVRIVTEAPLRTGNETPRIHVVADDPRALAAALATRPEVAHLELSPHGVLASGPDARALAVAVNAAIVDAHAVVQRIEPASTSFEDLHADAVARLEPPAAPASARSTP